MFDTNRIHGPSNVTKIVEDNEDARLQDYKIVLCITYIMIDTMLVQSFLAEGSTCTYVAINQFLFGTKINAMGNISS